MPAPLADDVRRRIAAARAPSLAAARAWRRAPAFARLDRHFARIDDADAAVAAAGALLADPGWTTALLDPLVAGLAADPFFEPPLRTSRDALKTGAIVYECAAASIAATVLSARALRRLPRPATVVVPGRHTLTRYLRAGDATLRRWHVAPAEADFSAATAGACVEAAPRAIADGDVVHHDGRRQGHLVVDAAADVVALSITIRLGTAPVMREYRIADGALVRVAALDDRASRTQMLLAFLRHADTDTPSDTAPVFDAATRDPAFFVRWEAMREWLALDARAALPRLADMARVDPNAEVRAAAAATLALAQRRMAACPA